MEFKKLHEQNEPLLICNVWDVPSTKAAEKLNFQAVGTSSAAIATMIGYNDGENLSFSELTYFVKRIKANTSLPLSVDVESGYSRDPELIVRNINELIKLGISGINIEDSVVAGNRVLIEREQFSKTIEYTKSKISDEVFINVRTDTFLLGLTNAVEETKKRIELYEQTGADGIFVPSIVKEDDIKAVVESTELPINVMCMPDLPGFEKLKELGVKRISMGNFLFDKMYGNFEQTLNSIKTDQSFKAVFENVSN